MAGDLDGADPATLRASRSARHSKFPECSTCSSLRKAWKIAACSDASTPEQVQEAFQAFLDHTQEWHADRQTALAIRRSCFLPHSPAIYQCDDKCGSQWQMLPVDPTGRHSKSGIAKTYPFAVQANVVCGQEGLIRFAVVPKFITTGSNFGLTNLIMAIYNAFLDGRLKPNHRVLYRHTDGGPDNISHVTHILHWLLVYLGVFEEIVWFRFEAGHSHTEIADRLFSILKKLFESDNNSRVQAVPTFDVLEQKIQEAFASCPEAFNMEFNFANWDLEQWLSQMVPGVDSSLFEGKFARYSFDNVYRYTYVGNELWEHGGVKVTYKQRLSHKGTPLDAEWAPLERVVGKLHNSNVQVSKNVTTKGGVSFIPRPPDLRREPSREEWNDKHDTASAACKSIISGRAAGDLSNEDKLRWRLLQAMHEKCNHSWSAPNLPTTIEVTGDTSTGSFLPPGQPASQCFHGTPSALLPKIKELMRFKRPLISWDIFNEEAPAEFQPLGNDGQDEELGQTDLNHQAETSELRDPRCVNSVAHSLYTPAEVARDTADVLNEAWAKEQPSRVEKVVGGHLYLLKMDSSEKGEMKMALARVEESDKGLVAWWYVRCGTNHTWGQPSTFKKWPDPTNWGSDPVDLDAIILPVTMKDLTENEDQDKSTRLTVQPELERPCLTAEFVRKVRLFAKVNGLHEVEPQKRSRNLSRAEHTDEHNK